MKKSLLLFVFAFAASVVYAQYRDMYSLLYHDKTDYYYVIHNPMQQRDGDHIIDVYLCEDIGNDECIPRGSMCYKISTATQSVTDSLFMADTAMRMTFLSRDPRGEGNIRALIEYHADCDSSFVRISRFPDDDLHANPGEDVLVPVCEGDAWICKNGSLIDSQGDLVMTYYRPVEIGAFGTISNQYIARIGLDGTLKRQALLADSLWYDFGPLRVLKDSPLQYYQWWGSMSYPYTDLAVYVIDSLFRRDTVNLNGLLRRELLSLSPYYPYDTTLNIYEYEYLRMDYQTQVISSGGNDVLVAAPYIHDTSFHTTRDYGVAVAKYDLSTKKLKGYAVFNDSHAYYSEGYPMGLKMLGDGTVYFMYKEHGCYPEESVIIVKMDTDLNVEWKRFCKTWNIRMSSPLESSTVFDDGDGEEKGVAWCGYAIKDGNHSNLGWAYFLLNHDGPATILDEPGIEVRPYAYYPNPAQSVIHLNYSPDVQPARIELYDLQGCLLHAQDNSLENVDIQSLAAGQYLMKVSMKDGKEYTDKVVKE